MRISDWSSDVFSSDLRGSCSSAISIGHRGLRRHPFGGGVHVAGLDLARQPVTVALAIIGLGIVDRRVVEPELIEREPRSEEHTSELQSLMRISYAVFCLKKKRQHRTHQYILHIYMT